MDPKVVAESVKGELVFVVCVDDGGKNGPPVNVKCDENGAAPIRLLRLSDSVFWMLDPYVLISLGLDLKGLMKFGGDGFTPKSLLPLLSSPDEEVIALADPVSHTRERTNSRYYVNWKSPSRLCGIFRV